MKHRACPASELLVGTVAGPAEALRTRKDSDLARPGSEPPADATRGAGVDHRRLGGNGRGRAVDGAVPDDVFRFTDPVRGDAVSVRRAGPPSRDDRNRDGGRFPRGPPVTR